jgi:hypothetical protein
MKRIIVFVIALLMPLTAWAQNTLTEVPYWKLMAGWWRAENTYMDGALNYNIRSYNSILHIELDGRTYRETEYKFYAPSKLAQQYGRGLITTEEGIETVSVTTGELIDDKGTVRLISEPGTIIQVLNADTGVRVTPNTKTNVDTYRMFIFAPASDKRYRSNFGIVSDKTGAGAANAAADAKLGDLRGYALFREDRIAPTEFDKWRQEFRARNTVKAIVEAGPDGKPAVRRLD